ncbi:GNAT family N-acetyltransferase [bacterium]|nr:GNAT family N-acetyltransferase [bacterium]
MKEITLAKHIDIDNLIPLLTQLFASENEFKPNFEKQKNGLEKIINAPEIGEILVIKVDNKIVGMVSLLYSISTALGGKVAIFEDMVIDQAFRKKDYGTDLLNEAINFAKKRGCLRITLLTDFNNDIAIAFYKSNGFVRSEMIPFRLKFNE